MTFTAHYWRYGTQATEEADTLAEAVAFLAFGWSAGELSEQHITGPDGSVVLEGSALFAQMKERVGA